MWKTDGERKKERKKERKIRLRERDREREIWQRERFDRNRSQREIDRQTDRHKRKTLLQNVSAVCHQAVKSSSWKNINVVWHLTKNNFFSVAHAILSDAYNVIFSHIK